MQRLDLTGKWELFQDGEKGSIPANVPGDNLSALLQAQKWQTRISERTSSTFSGSDGWRVLGERRCSRDRESERVNSAPCDRCR